MKIGLPKHSEFIMKNIRWVVEHSIIGTKGGYLYIRPWTKEPEPFELLRKDRDHYVRLLNEGTINYI